MHLVFFNIILKCYSCLNLTRPGIDDRTGVLIDENAAPNEQHGNGKLAKVAMFCFVFSRSKHIELDQMEKVQLLEEALDPG